jgi:hypothetical protein
MPEFEKGTGDDQKFVPLLGLWLSRFSPSACESSANLLGQLIPVPRHLESLAFNGWSKMFLLRWELAYGNLSRLWAIWCRSRP